MTNEEKATQYVISRSEKANSHEFGPAGNRFKLYFDTPEELQIMMNKLSKLGIYTEEPIARD